MINNSLKHNNSKDQYIIILLMLSLEVGNTASASITISVYFHSIIYFFNTVKLQTIQI